MSCEPRQHRLHLVQEWQWQCYHHRGRRGSGIPELHPREELGDAEKPERIRETGSTARVRGNLNARAVLLAYERCSYPPEAADVSDGFSSLQSRCVVWMYAQRISHMSPSSGFCP